MISLEAEVNIVPLKHRRHQLLLQYFAKVLRLQNHPVTISFNNYRQDNIVYNNSPWTPPVIGRAKKIIEASQLPISDMEDMCISNLYLIGDPEVRFSMRKYNKRRFTEEQLQQHFLALKNEVYNDFFHIFTDGSKMNDNTGYAFVANNYIEYNRLPSICSVFTAELYAIYRAVKYSENTHWNKIVIFSDSLSVLQTIKSFKLKCHYMFKLQRLLAFSRKEIILEWVPAHVGIHGNTKADEAAKEATNSGNQRHIILHYYDVKSLIRMFILQKWQQD